MLGVTLRLARGTAGRLAAAGLAIALGAAFVAAVLLATGLLQRTAHDQVASGYAGADVVVDAPPGSPLDQGAVDDLGSLPGARGAVGAPGDAVQLVAGTRTVHASLATTTSTEPFASLPSATPEEGALPGAPGEVAVTADVAGALDVAVGQRVLARTHPSLPADGSDDAAAGGGGSTDTPVTVVALLPSAGALGTGTALVAPEQARAWATPGAPDTSLRSAQVLVAAEPGTSADTLRERVAGAVPGATSRTADAASQDAVDDLTDGQDVLTGVLLAFAVLAVLVAGVVITNTFAVLVAQRTRQLALLRCVGATAGQVRAGVLAEAVLLGLAASLVGTAAGTGLAAAAAAVLARTTDGTVPASVTITPASVLVPLALGTAATVLAALAPARAATRVAPLAALRPPAPVGVAAGGSRPRLVAAALLVLGGGGALAAGLLLGEGSPGTGLLLSLAGGAVSFVGVLVGAVFVVPALVGAVGGLVARAGGASARLSVANAVRNPRRTTTTTSALLIGVTLVCLVVVGAASTQRTLAATLDSSFPVDAEVGSVPGPPSPTGPDDAPARPAALPAEVTAAVQDVDGVAAVAPLRGAAATGEGPEGRLAVPVRGVDPEQARSVLQAPDEVARLSEGTALVPDGVARLLGVEEGQRLALTDGDRRLTVEVAVTTLSAGTVLLTPGDLDQLAPQAPVGSLWVRLDAGADPAGSVDAIRTAVAGDVAGGTVQSVDGAAGDAVPVSGAAVQRASYDRVITILLSVVVGLLAVAVLIAFVGVANTLSLSVLERTRESALLRALGLTRGQLRAMLALEGALVAGVGALVGVVLGVGYGWAGARALLVGAGPVRLDLPWGSLAAVLAVSVLAGLGASVLPGRRAARTAPAAALGE